jgi:hypothetical protein
MAGKEPVPPEVVFADKTETSGSKTDPSWEGEFDPS